MPSLGAGGLVCLHGSFFVWGGGGGSVGDGGGGRIANG